MSIDNNVSPKSYLSKFYACVQDMGATSTADMHALSNGFITQFLVPVRCKLNKAMFSMGGVDVTASNGVVATLKNESVSANIFTTKSMKSGTTGFLKGAGATLSATNVADISAMSLLTLTVSATVGSGNLAAAFEFDVNKRYSRAFQHNGGVNR